MMLQQTISQACNDTIEAQFFRWPAHLAKDMADSIHEKVRSMISRSRLATKSQGIHLVQKGDIISVEKVLGSGAFSQVSAVVCKGGKRYACKHLKQDLMSKPNEFRLAAAELACEAHMLASFDHPNILKVRGWSYNGIAAFEEGRHDSFFLLLDMLDETLEQRIDRWRLERIVAVPEDQSLYLRKLHIMQQIASALSYLHEHGVIFRDLKPNNIGFLGDQVQLFDFGLSRELPELDTTVPFEMSGRVGTLRYMANEVAMRQPYNLSADIYSFGMVSYELLSLVKPFDGWTRDMHSSFVCQRGMRPDTVNCISPIPWNMRVLLEQAWHGDPSQRPTISQISSQLNIFKEQELLLLEGQQLQIHLTQQIEAQLEAQFEAQLEAQLEAQRLVVYADAAYHMAPSPPHKVRRYLTSDSMETIETTSLSGESSVN